ncbi:hypothetical protein RB653_006262 [Dictyostelium firmibasis]|uniref:UspA domain-containing protein n=1 Tax=Dictyostelium firmibasis TaxID=79012 RepID=A0AAN7Z1W0_9MYCE
MKVLLAVDGSQSSNQALLEAFKTINSSRDILDIITVDNFRTSPPQDVDAGERILLEYVDRCKDQGFILDNNLSAQVLHGDVRNEIIRYIKECGPFDRIMVGSRGLGTFKKLVLGSVSEYLVHHSPIPVYVVKSDGSCKVSDPAL